MPELPEVETIVRTLETSLMNETISAIDLRYSNLVEAQSEFDTEALIGASFVSFQRRGKYLWFTFSNGLSLILHLRMEGKFYLYKDNHKPTKHTHMIITTEHYHVHYLDTRKFSRFAIVRDAELYFKQKKLGFEPWDEALTGAFLYQQYQKTQRAIKVVLLDQAIVTGVGNIYADEILYRVRIHPLTPANKISRQKCSEIVVAMREVLENAILAGGTTIRSYTSSLNVHGRFQIELDAYGREGEPCNRCGTTMKRIVVGGRSSVFCPKCQKVKR